MKKLFLFILTLSTIQAMEQTEGYFKKLPTELQRVIALYVADAPTIEKAYTNVMSLLRTSKGLMSLRNDPSFMNQLVDLLYVKFIDPLTHPRQAMQKAVSDARKLTQLINNEHALQRYEHLISEAQQKYPRVSEPVLQETTLSVELE